MNPLEGMNYGQVRSMAKSLVDNGSYTLGKALSAGEGTGSDMTDLDTLTGGRAITLENIDTNLKVTAESTSDLIFWKLLRNKPIYAVLDQFVQLIDHGIESSGHVFGAHTNETEFPENSDITLARRVESTRFIRARLTVTHVMDQVDAMEDAHQITNNAGAMKVMEANERSTMYGNTAAMPSQQNGFYKRCQDAYDAGYTKSIIDCRAQGTDSDSQGSQITESQLEQGSLDIMQALGRASHMVMPATVKSDLNALLPLARRVNLPGANMMNNPAANRLGLPANGFVSDFAYNGWGDQSEAHFKFVPSIDLMFPSGESIERKAPAVLVGANGPAAITSATLTAAASGALASEFQADDAGDYFYKIAAYNDKGIAAAVAVVAGAVTVAIDQKVTVAITGADANTTGYSIYRSALDAADNSDCRWIGDFEATTPAGVTSIVDLNHKLPGTSDSILLSNAPETDAVDYRQLMPFMRMALPFGQTNIVGYPYLYMLYTYLRVQKLINERQGGTYHILYTNIRSNKSTF